LIDHEPKQTQTHRKSIAIDQMIEQHMVNAVHTADWNFLTLLNQAS
jgi:hypothetical protein